MVTAAVKERKWSEDAQRITTLLDQCETDWGTPEDNRKNLLPFGIRPLDKAVYGMDLRNGELVLIQGGEKQRKSTFVANVIRHYMQSPKPEVKPLTVIDTLESGMTPKRYRDMLISMVATEILLKEGHVLKEFCPLCKGTCEHVGKLTPEYLMYNTRTDEQQRAIKQALEIMREWPLMIYGASEAEGETRNLAASVYGGVDLQSRWQYLIEFYDAKVFVTDHLQQYSFDGTISDYEKQIRTIAAVSDMVARYKIVNLLLSQISLTSQREAATGTGKVYAAGGKKGAAEATLVLTTNYENSSGQMTITLEDSRRSGTFSIYQPLDDVSGVYWGEATASDKKAEQREGADDGKYRRR